jgi:hypothetical protein
MPEQTQPQGNTPRPQRLRRLSFEYDGHDVQLLDDEDVEAIHTASHPAELHGSYSHWFEVLDSGGKRLYHQLLPGHPAGAPEVFHHEEPVKRDWEASSRGAFTIYVPAPGPGEEHEVRLHRPHPHPDEAAAHPAGPTVLGAFKLRYRNEEDDDV